MDSSQSNYDDNLSSTEWRASRDEEPSSTATVVVSDEEDEEEDSGTQDLPPVVVKRESDYTTDTAPEDVSEELPEPTSILLSTPQEEEASSDATAATPPAVMASSGSTEESTKATKRVTFGQLDIHEHVMAMGGAVPSCGVPLTIEAQAQEHYSISIEDYEQHRERPRKGTAMLRPKQQRTDLLLSLGYTMREINTCTKECAVIRNERAQSLKEMRPVWKRILGCGHLTRRGKNNQRHPPRLPFYKRFIPTRVCKKQVHIHTSVIVMVVLSKVTFMTTTPWSSLKCSNPRDDQRPRFSMGRHRPPRKTMIRRAESCILPDRIE